MAEVYVGIFVSLIFREHAVSIIDVGVGHAQLITLFSFTSRSTDPILR